MASKDAGHVALPLTARRRLRVAPLRRQGGALTVLFAAMLVVLLAFVGLALDIAQVYNRRTELQNIADSVALAAAKALDGTASGITSALARAKDAGEGRIYSYKEKFTWDDTAISFSAAATTPDAGWVDAAAATTSPAGMLFARVDTGKMAASYGTVQTALLGMLGAQFAQVVTFGRAVAGRSSIRVTPLAICALNTSSTPVLVPDTSSGEKSRFGFRIGVGYNLLNLNPKGLTALNFVVNPIDIPVSTAAAVNVTPAVVAPFVCTGTVPMAKLPAALHVKYPFPTSLIGQLNSRFDEYGDVYPCDPVSAPPDRNIRQFNENLPVGTKWWNIPLNGQITAKAMAGVTRRVTIADRLSNEPKPVYGGDYGVLWAFAIPTGTAGNLDKSKWNEIYPVTGTTQVANASYPLLGTTPYTSSDTGGKFFTKPPTRIGARQRRVLNIPLLDCTNVDVSSTTAPVLAVGTFLMTVKADSNSASPSISGEFGGVVESAALGDQAKLYQ
jgi:Flp pilus assembly protein TadG